MKTVLLTSLVMNPYAAARGCGAERAEGFLPWRCPMRMDAIAPGRWVQTTTAAFEVTLTTPSSSSTMVETVTTTHDPVTGTQRTLRGGAIDPNFPPLPNPA